MSAPTVSPESENTTHKTPLSLKFHSGLNFTRLAHDPNHSVATISPCFVVSDNDDAPGWSKGDILYPGSGSILAEQINDWATECCHQLRYSESFNRGLTLGQYDAHADAELNALAAESQRGWSLLGNLESEDKRVKSNFAVYPGAWRSTLTPWQLSSFKDNGAAWAQSQGRQIHVEFYMVCVKASIS